MKPSQMHLGQEIQLYLLRQGYQVEALAREMGITPEGLSNLIHGRRRFKDETLAKMAATRIFKKGDFTLHKLKALRAMDEYGFNELILAVLENIRRGEIARLPKDFFQQVQQELEKSGFPPDLVDKKHALLELVQSSRL